MKKKGDDGIRTRDKGFADPCLTTWRRRQKRTAGTMPADSLERATGFEPVAFSLARRRSTTEPRPRTCCLHVKKDNQCQDPDLNWGHLHFQCSALPTELSRRDKGPSYLLKTSGILTNAPPNVKCNAPQLRFLL